MSGVRRVVLASVIALTVAGGAAGCGGDDEPSGGSVPVDTGVTFPDTVTLPDGSPATTTATGDLEITGSLPPGFPDDFPLPDGARIEFGSATVVGNDDVRSVDLAVPGDVVAVAQFYRDVIEDSGFAVLYDEIGNLRFETDSFVGDVLISARDEDTVNLVLTATSPRD